MSTQLSTHYVTDIRARHYPEIPSLTLEIYIDGAAAPNSIVLFCEDVVLNERIVEAINNVARARAEEKALAPQSENNDVADYNHRADDEEIVF